MPIYRYKAKRKDAQTVLGQIEADTKDAAVEKMTLMELIPVSLEEDLQDTHSSSSHEVKERSVRAKDIYLFSRQLSHLTKSGISILRTLELIASQIRNPYFRFVIERIHGGIKEGRNFSDCLADYPKLFSGLYIMMIRAGEESGNLKETTADVANYLQEQQELASKVRTAIAYPLFMLLFGIGTVIFILTFVMPKITTVFENFNQELPLPTQIVMALSDFLLQQWLWLMISLAGMALALYQYSRTPAGQLSKSRLKLNLPLFGAFWLKVELARFCSTLQLLLKSGIPIVRALQLSTPMVSNLLIQNELTQCQEDLLAGKSLGESLKGTKLVPALIGDLIVVGEESGSLSTTLRDIADSYQQDTNEFVKLLTTLLEPLMILTIGSIIGFIVIAMLLPIFSLDIFAR